MSENLLVEPKENATAELHAHTATQTASGTSNSQKSGFQKTRWYLSRLASMAPAEMAWRARSAATMPLDWARCKMPASVPSARWTGFRPESYPVKLHSCGASMARIRIFDLDFPVGFEFDWHRDYRYERQIERRFAASLNIRDTNVVSDVKYVWEPSRHQHLSALAFAANGEEQSRYIVQSLDSWLHANRYLEGVHWTSSLEMAERMISWALLYPRIADHVAHNANFRHRWLTSIYQHLQRISRKPSLYSSANNHRIGELVGLFVGSTCFDFWSECSRWRESARESLEREILCQIGGDGVNREQAISYHLFTLELFLLAFLVGENSHRPFHQAYAERLRGMAAFLDAIATADGDLPWYGDSDDARGFVLSENESSLAVTMQLAALAFDEPRWLRFCPLPTAAARAFLPQTLGRLEQTQTARPPDSAELFPDAGLACVRTRDDTLRLMMDFGPLGFLAPAGHGHADALAVWLAVDGEYVLVDAGTYAYHSHPEWRTYFRSTPAHNTVCIDGKDQSEMAGRFLWSSKANARLLGFESSSERVTIEAEHDGYKRLADPVTHQRKVSLNRHNGFISIEDRFLCSGHHRIELFFHLHEDAWARDLRPGNAQFSWRGRNISFSSPDGNARWQIIRGSENPRLGWRSRQFNQKHPISTLRIQKEIEGSTTICTHLRIQS
jgi:Heparinase II/III-like protein/Heparinase II/III N-terminus